MQLTGWVDSSVSVVLGIVLLVPSVILFLFQAWLVKKYAIKTATVGGRISSSDSVKSSLVARTFLFAVCAFLSLIVLAQFVSIIAGSFQKLWGINKAFTLEHIKSVGHYLVQRRNFTFFCLHFIKGNWNCKCSNFSCVI